MPAIMPVVCDVQVAPVSDVTWTPPGSSQMPVVASQAVRASTAASTRATGVGPAGASLAKLAKIDSLGAALHVHLDAVAFGDHVPLDVIPLRRVDERRVPARELHAGRAELVRVRAREVGHEPLEPHLGRGILRLRDAFELAETLAREAAAAPVARSSGDGATDRKATAAAREAAKSTLNSVTQSLCASASTSTCSTFHVRWSSEGTT